MKSKKTGPFPWVGRIIKKIEKLLHDNGYLGLVLIDLRSLADIETECGKAIYNEVIDKVGEQIAALRQSLVRRTDLVCTVQPLGEEILLFLGPPRKTEHMTMSALERVADRIGSVLGPAVADLAHRYRSHGRLNLGYCLTLPNPMIQIERLLYRAIEHARTTSGDYSRRVNARSRETLRDLIVRRQLNSVFQPIVQLSGTEVRAYEALIRGPSGTDLANPAMLFSLAGNANLTAELDRACCECHLANAIALPEGSLLFANVLPALINDPAFRSSICGPDAKAPKPSSLVLELNEGVAVRNYEVLARGLNELRAQGIRVALDDVGTGHTNLHHVLQLKPDFLKLDISLVRHIDQNPAKQALVKSMVAMGQAVGATLIAEGIENAAERETLISLGMTWGQGYLFARPEPGFSPLRAAKSEGATAEQSAPLSAVRPFPN